MEELEKVAEEFHYSIEDDMQAEWAMRKIREAQAEKAKWKKFYDERYASVCASCDQTIANMEAMLHTFFDSVPHKKTKTQENYALPSGKLVFKRQEPEYQRNDEEVIAWLKEHDGQRFIKNKETLDWSSLKNNVTVVGEIVANEYGEPLPITAVQRPDIFKVELTKEKENNDDL